jgi:hypothetical protein
MPPDKDEAAFQGSKLVLGQLSWSTGIELERSFSPGDAIFWELNSQELSGWPQTPKY